MRLARRGLLCCGVAAGPLFVGTFSLAGARRPGYEPLRHPVSSLSLGPGGWVQAANFAATGMLYLAGAAGLSRAPDSSGDGRLGPGIFAATGIGLLGAAAFRTDPVSGYPRGTPDAPVESTATGALHNIAAVPVFLGIPAGAFAFARRFRGSGEAAWSLYSAATGTAMLVAASLAGAGFGQARGLVDRAGAFQRVAIVTGFTWLTALSLRALRLVAGRTS